MFEMNKDCNGKRKKNGAQECKGCEYVKRTMSNVGIMMERINFPRGNIALKMI